LVERGPRGLVLAALNADAQALGLRLGQAHADACALAPSLKSEPVKPGQAEEALRRLALWAQRYGPLVALDQGFAGEGAYGGLEGLFIETTGADHLFGGEQALLADLTTRLARAGAVAQVGLAGTPGAAWALARFASPHAIPNAAPNPVIAPPGGEAGALASLPVEALRLSPAAVQLLGRFGLRRIGDLYALPRAGLARRFRGETGMGVIQRLDQALGRLPEPLTGETAPDPYFAHRVFAEPILHAEGVAQWGERLAVDLCAKLDEAGLGARRIVLTGFRNDGRTTWMSAALGLASRDPDHLIRLLRERGWARLEVGFGLDALRLSAPVTEALAPSQTSLEPPLLLPCEAGEEKQVRGKPKDWAAAADPATHRARAALIDRLTARLGEAAVLRPVWRESWTPERAERLAPWAVAPLTASSEPPTSPPGAQARPILLFTPPEPIEAVAQWPDGAPARFTWRRAARRVARASGPERLAPDWWRRPSSRDRPAVVRDYYRLEDEDGGRYWVFREGLYGAPPDLQDRPPSWWMHGLFP
jgi:protein ImuB